MLLTHPATTGLFLVSLGSCPLVAIHKVSWCETQEAGFACGEPWRAKRESKIRTFEWNSKWSSHVFVVVSYFVG